MTTIQYNGIDAFSGISLTPLVSREVSTIQAGERIGELHTFTLRGQISGIALSGSQFSGFASQQQQLISNFSKDFQTFSILDSGSGVFSQPYAKIADISFPSNGYSYILPYEIKIECYPSGYFSGTYGVLEPNEEIKFDEGKDGMVTLNHVISARGFNTSAGDNNALQNARDWVTGRAGWNSQIFPYFITYSNFTPCLKSVATTIDRLNAKYEMNETYLTDTYLSGIGVLRYTTEYNYDVDSGISKIRINGGIQGCQGGAISDLRARYLAFNSYAEANNVLFKITGRSDLFPIPLSKSVVEDSNALKLTFSFEYSDDETPMVVFDYKIAFDYNLELDIVTAKIDGHVHARGNFENRWAMVENLANQINLFAIVLPEYQTYIASIGLNNAVYPLNPNPISSSRSENPFNAEITLAATYDNKVIPPNGFQTFNYTLDFTPAIEQYAAVPCLDGQGSYTVFDLGYLNRAKLGINAQGVGNDAVNVNNLPLLLKLQIQMLQAQYFAGSRMNLDSQEITTGNSIFGKQVEGKAVFSAEQIEFNL